MVIRSLIWTLAIACPHPPHSISYCVPSPLGSSGCSPQNEHALSSSSRLLMAGLLLLIKEPLRVNLTTARVAAVVWYADNVLNHYRHMVLWSRQCYAQRTAPREQRQALGPIFGKPFQ